MFTFNFLELVGKSGCGVKPRQTHIFVPRLGLKKEDISMETQAYGNSTSV